MQFVPALQRILLRVQCGAVATLVLKNLSQTIRSKGYTTIIASFAPKIERLQKIIRGLVVLPHPRVGVAYVIETVGDEPGRTYFLPDVERLLKIRHGALLFSFVDVNPPDIVQAVRLVLALAYLTQRRQSFFAKSQRFVVAARAFLENPK